MIFGSNLVYIVTEIQVPLCRALPWVPDSGLSTPGTPQATLCPSTQQSWMDRLKEERGVQDFGLGRMSAYGTFVSTESLQVSLLFLRDSRGASLCADNRLANLCHWPQTHWSAAVTRKRPSASRLQRKQIGTPTSPKWGPGLWFGGCHTLNNNWESIPAHWWLTL